MCVDRVRDFIVSKDDKFGNICNLIFKSLNNEIEKYFELRKVVDQNSPNANNLKDN